MFISEIEKTNKCLYCGNNQVPHFINWYYESLNILLTPLRQFLLYNFLVKKLQDWEKFKIFFQGTVWFLEKIKIFSRQTKMENCKVRRAQVLWEEAQKRGIKFCELLLFKKPFDTYLAEKQDIVQPKLQKRIIFSGLPRPQNSHNPVLDVMDDKWLLKKIFSGQNLPVPRGGSAWNFRQAKKIFESLEKPVIVKPRTGSRGRHTFTFVRTEDDLRQAFVIAKKLNFWVMVEEQLTGPIFRATVINFQLAGVLRGDPPSVRGDGRSNLEQLINMKNLASHPGVSNILIDQKMEMFLERQLKGNNQDGTDQNNPLRFVPKEREMISLSEKIGVSYGGSSAEDFEICHEDNKQLFVRAARALNEPVVGFDFIIPDISKSFKEQRCGFIEANSLPFINLHHNPLHGQPRNVAALVWDMLGW